MIQYIIHVAENQETAFTFIETAGKEYEIIKYLENS
jgi:hypothetical protein